MAVRAQLVHSISLPISGISTFPSSFLKHPYHKFQKSWKISKWACKLDQSERPLNDSTVDIQQMITYLYEDFSHVFDDQGFDHTAFDECVTFSDPITKFDTLAGYLSNIALLKLLFQGHYKLHWVKQTGPYEITTRWTTVMTFVLLPWKPELVFTGTSVMRINPETGKFCSHVDCWDSIKDNDYFSTEGLWDVFRQLRMYKTPDLETPEYHILKRTADYEVRKYAPFVVVETKGDKLSGSAGFNSVTGLPDLNQETIKVEGGIAAALKFSGKITEDIVKQKERELRDSLVRDGLRPRKGCMLARYNDPGRTWEFIMRNEVLIWLQDFSLEN